MTSDFSRSQLFGGKMASSRIVKGTIKNSSSHIIVYENFGTTHGTTETSPPAQLGANGGQGAFEIVGHFGAYGAEGSATYKAADKDATFNLTFGSPFSHKNYATINCTGNDCSLFTCSATNWSNSGDEIDPLFTISDAS